MAYICKEGVSPMAGERSAIHMKIQVTEVLTVLAVACYWGWTHLTCFTPFGSFYGQNVRMAWFALSACGLAMSAVAVAAHRQCDRGVTRFGVLLVAALMGAVGSVMLTGPFSNSIALCGIAVMFAFGPLCFFPFVGTVSRRLVSERALSRCFFAAMALSFLVYVVGYAVPSEIAAVLCVILPVASAAACRAALSSGFRLESEPSTVAQSSGNASALLVVYIIVFSIVLGYLTALLSQSFQKNAVYPFDIGMLVQVAVIVGLAVILEFLASVKGCTVMPLVVAILLTLSLVVCAAAYPVFPSAVLPVVAASYFLFVPIFSLKCAQIARRSRQSASKPVALGILCNMLGLLVGEVAGMGLGALDSTVFSLVLAVAVCIVFILSFFVAAPKTPRSFLSFMSLDSQNGADIEASSPTGEGLQTIADSMAAQAERAANAYGLTKREAEMLGYLLRGRELQTIAEMESLSRNTVKTHISHIYQKMGVHTREELVMAVERLARSDGAV